MNKQKVTGTVWVYDTPHGLTFFMASMDTIPGYVCRGKSEVTVEIDPIDKDRAIQDLHNSAEDVNAEATATVRSIMQQIKEIEAES
jgi:hypothetical protein